MRLENIITFLVLSISYNIVSFAFESYSEFSFSSSTDSKVTQFKFVSSKS